LVVTCNGKAGRTILLWLCWHFCWVQCWTCFSHYNVQLQCFRHLFMVGSVYFIMNCIILSVSISREV
jgi:hypothetical protein